jgi:MFS family permease
LVGLLAGPFLSMVDANIVNVALPDIASQLHAPLAAAQWIISAYLLSLAVVLPASAYLAKRFGTRRIYLASLAGFTLASLACAFAPNLPSLISARILQGALGAPLIPLAMNVLFNPRTQQESQMGPLAAAAAGVALFLAPALGPSLGGLLITAGGWPLIFLVNVPFGLLGLLCAARIPLTLAGRGDRAAHFDPLGLLVLGAGLALAIYGATQGRSAAGLTRRRCPTGRPARASSSIISCGPSSASTRRLTSSCCAIPRPRWPSASRRSPRS